MRAFLFITSIILCVALDMGSKSFIENNFSFEYCRYKESQTTENPLTVFTAMTDL